MANQEKDQELEKEIPAQDPEAEAQASKQEVSEEGDSETKKSKDKKSKKQEEKSEEQLLIEKLQKENQELNEKVLRQYAEFDNFKKRTAREKDTLYAYAKGDTVSKIFPVLDVFEQALKTQTEDEAFYKGVVMIHERFKAILGELGVIEVPGVGAEFDPNLHNAVSRVEDENYGENVVCQVYQTGYQLGDKVLRPAMVVVANP